MSPDMQTWQKIDRLLDATLTNEVSHKASIAQGSSLMRVAAAVFSGVPSIKMMRDASLGSSTVLLHHAPIFGLHHVGLIAEDLSKKWMNCDVEEACQSCPLLDIVQGCHGKENEASGPSPWFNANESICPNKEIRGLTMFPTTSGVVSCIGIQNKFSTRYKRCPSYLYSLFKRLEKIPDLGGGENREVTADRGGGSRLRVMVMEWVLFTVASLPTAGFTVALHSSIVTTGYWRRSELQTEGEVRVMVVERVLLAVALWW
ncbi:unnamed protein product [Fraxinus pennsylvanica]|uniref:Uncharacterized protein n=1 Tax=Fraxinus pennsylvanica TaxID=56036 RepID=A0AAD1ZI05_9LAMI|nr:unnamed protein product [Fraxinus pennsylvanica]